MQKKFIYGILFGILLTLHTVTANATTNASGVVIGSSHQVASTAAKQHITESTNKTVPVTSNVNVATKCLADSPCSVISGTSKQVLAAVDKGLVQSETITLIQNVVAPQFDFTLMTKYALGNNWKLATPEQQMKLIKSFKDLLIYTYASALYKFRGAQVTLIGTVTNGRKATVITQVILPSATNNNTQPVKVEYDLASLPQNNNLWKVYDIKIENASLVTTYRNQFNDVIQTSKIDGLIKQLQTKLANLKSNVNSQ